MAIPKIVGWGLGFYCHLSLVQGGWSIATSVLDCRGSFWVSRVLIVLGGSLGWLEFEWFDFGAFLFAMVLQLSWEGCFGI